MKTAVVEIGSNGVRYELFESVDNRLVSLDKRARHLDLSSAFEDNHLTSRTKLVEAAELADSYVALAKSYGADHVECFGTEICRKIAQKEPEFWSDHGIHVSVLSAREEAEAAFLTAEQSIRHFEPSKPRAVIDVGNGSTEIYIVGKDNEPVYISFPIGAAKLAKAFEENNSSISSLSPEFNPSDASENFLGNTLENCNVVLSGGLIIKIAWILYRPNFQTRFSNEKINNFQSSVVEMDAVEKRILNAFSSSGVSHAKMIVDPFENGSWKMYQVLSGIKYYRMLSSVFRFENYTICSAGIRMGIASKGVFR